MKKFTSEKQKIGLIGENLACKYIVKQGFKVLERNYTKKCGEIDIITEKNGILHFFEVKTVSCVTIKDVSYETNAYKPEDNMHPWKIKRLGRTIQLYLLNRNDEKDWQFNVICVYLSLKDKKARVNVLYDIVLY